MPLIADVVFDLPLPHPFSYEVPGGLTVVAGQRVLAPLGGATRPGLVVAVHEDAPATVKPLAGLLESAAILSADQLELCRWIAAESCSSLGATCAGLLPPPLGNALLAPPTGLAGAPGVAPEVLVGRDREDRTREEVASHSGGVLVLTAEVSTAAEWAGRLGALGPVARLDSGVTDGERARSWSALASGRGRIAVGTRSALLAPVPPPALVALVDEHDPAHKPPGAPRIHARDVVLRRALVEGGRVLLPSATPSVEMWWRLHRGLARLRPTDPGTWPSVSVADTRGTLRRDPFTPTLARAAHEAFTSGRRICLLLSRLASALACEDCGSVARCPACAICFSFSRIDKTLGCRLCGRRDPASETCPACGGRRLTPFGWGAERVELALRRRFPRARIARYDPDAMRGARLATQRREALEADIVVGTRGALRLFPAGSLGLVGVVALDQILRIADFRAGERAFALLWAAAERLDPTGRLVIQSQNPEHHVVRAVLNHDRALFYGPELRFRSELGYPPFRRLCRVTVRARSEPGARALAEVTASRIRQAGPVVVYPALPDRRGLEWRIIVKGPTDLPRLIAGSLAGQDRPSRSRGIIEVEMDPVD